MLTADKERALAHLIDRAERIRERVSIAEVLDALGVDYARNKGKIHCLYPDHVERTGSMKVYEKTNSAYCFGCGRSADVIDIVRLCGSKDAQRASLGQAVRWFETNFGIASGSAKQNLRERIDSRLSSWRKHRNTTALPKSALVLQIIQLKEAIQARYHKGTLATALWSIEDQIWNELEVTRESPERWATWARNVLRGPYTEAARHLQHPEETSLRSLRSSSREPDCFCPL